MILMPVEEAADLVQKPKQTLYRWIHLGELEIHHPKGKNTILVDYIQVRRLTDEKTKAQPKRFVFTDRQIQIAIAALDKLK